MACRWRPTKLQAHRWGFVMMPGLLRRQNEIVLFHMELFAVDNGVSLWVSSCYKAERAHAVTMSPCHLTRPEHLKADAQRQGRSLGRNTRVGKEQTAPASFFQA